MVGSEKPKYHPPVDNSTAAAARVGCTCNVHGWCCGDNRAPSKTRKARQPPSCPLCMAPVVWLNPGLEEGLDVASRKGQSRVRYKVLPLGVDCSVTLYDCHARTFVFRRSRSNEWSKSGEEAVPPGLSTWHNSMSHPFSPQGTSRSCRRVCNYVGCGRCKASNVSGLTLR